MRTRLVCGHLTQSYEKLADQVFSCGPCLHSALIAQPITQQLIRDLPNVAGNALEGTCPVCRRPLEGGWGRALRGAVLRMGTAEIPV